MGVEVKKKRRTDSGTRFKRILDLKRLARRRTNNSLDERLRSLGLLGSGLDGLAIGRCWRKGGLAGSAFFKDPAREVEHFLRFLQDRGLMSMGTDEDMEIRRHTRDEENGRKSGTSESIGQASIDRIGDAINEQRTYNVERVSDDLFSDSLELMARRKSIKQRRLAILPARHGHVRDIAVKLREPTRRLVNRSNAKDLESLFCQGTRLVKTANVNFSRDVDSVRRDAEDAGFAEAVDRKRRANREGCWQCRWDDDGDEIKCSDEDSVPFDLVRYRRKG